MGKSAHFPQGFTGFQRPYSVSGPPDMVLSVCELRALGPEVSYTKPTLCQEQGPQGSLRLCDTMEGKSLGLGVLNLRDSLGKSLTSGPSW